MKYRIFLILSMFSYVYFSGKTDPNYYDLAPKITKSKKIGEELMVYWQLLSHYSVQPNFEPYKSRFFSLGVEVHQALERNKRLRSLLSLYADNYDQQYLNQIHNILDTHAHLESLDTITKRVSEFLSELDTMIPGKDTKGIFTCEASQKIYQMHQQGTLCLEAKNYSCFEQRLDEIAQESIGHTRCIEEVLHKKGFSHRFLL